MILIFIFSFISCIKFVFLRVGIRFAFYLRSALLFLVFIVVLQQLEGNLIYPRVVGNSIGLPALWVLAAITVGGSLMGITGMLIGVPIAAALYRLLREELHRLERAEATGSPKPQA